MAVTAYLTPTLCANVNVGEEDWVSPDNAKTSNDVYASVSPPKMMGLSDILSVYTYGFSIPSGATIDGIEVKIEHKGGAANSIYDYIVQLLKAGFPVGSNKASASKWATSDEEITYPASGGATDKWETTWTAADINNAGFGVDLQVQNGNADNAVTAYVDCISIRVYYTETGTIYTKSIVAKSGTLPGKSRVVTAVRSKLALSGSAIPAKSRVITFARVQLAPSGTFVAKSRILTIVRAKVAEIGTKVAANRVLAAARVVLAQAGSNVITTRVVTVGRSISVALGTRVITARGWIRNYSMTISAGTLAIVSRAVTLARPQVVSGGTSVFPARIVVAGRQAVIATGTKVNTNITRIIARVWLVATGTNAIPSAQIIRNIIEKAILIPLGTAVSVSRQIVLARLKTATTGTIVLPGRLVTIARAQLAKTGTRVNTSVTRAIVRAKTLPTGTRTLVGRGIGRTKSIAVSIGTAVYYARQITVARPRVVRIGTKVNAVRGLVIVRAKLALTGTTVIARLNRAYSHYILIPSGTAVAAFRDFAQHIDAYIVIATGTLVHVNAFWKFTRKHLASLFGPRNKFLSDHTRRGPDEHNRPQWGGHQR